MASRFWVGGTGNWDAATTTHWAATSGGSGGASVPTSSDDVTFDSNSGTTATVTITATANANSITINKSDLTLTHSAGSTVVGAVTLTTGTLNTNGQTCSWGSLSSSNSNTRTLTLGASSITMTLNNGTAWDLSTSTNLTFNANTSTITIGASGSSGNTTTMNAGSLTYNSVVFAVSGTNQLCALTGSNPTFANLTVTGPGTTNAVFSLGTNITVSTALTFNGNSATTARLFVNSTVVGTQRTITNNGSGTFSNLDLQDIAGAGTASWNLLSITGGSGDCQGNSGITFTAARSLFWVGGTANWAGANRWSLSSGGSANQSTPLAQDNLTFDANSFSATGQTVTLNMPRAGKNIDFTNVTNSPTFATNLGASSMSRIYGSFTFSSSMSTSGTGQLFFEGRASNTLTTGGLTVPYSLQVNAPGNTLTVSGNINTTNTVAVRAGTLTVATANVTASSIQLSSNTSPAVAKTINMGSGTWTVTGTGFVWNTTNAAGGLTINSQTSTIVISDTSATSKSFAGNQFIYNTLTITGDNVSVLSSNTFTTLNLNNAGRSNGTKLGQGATQTITNLNANGSAGNLVVLASALSGTAATLIKTSGTVSVDYMSIQDSAATGGAIWYAGAHSTSVSNNTGWIFEAPPNWTSGWGIPI